MSYQALYRVWRPQRFEDIAGQEAVTRTLRNALMQKKTSHAYLFTGPRGTGKTSAAKIFAKAINCPYQKDGEPCNECETCRAITEGRLNDVIEIDAASNNGVEEIRDIRDKARYAPTQAAYKIYIIDEVHMLSTGAFNALLKTLEEPPGNVIFILATTEPHKIPLTIISRTQRFDFKRITYRDIINRMKYILEQEGITYDEEALHVVARAANGGMRDALSLLDQVISYDSHTVTFEHAVKVSGSLTEEMMLSFTRSLWQQDTEKALYILQSILEEGKEAGRFVEEMILFARDILVYKQTNGQSIQDREQVTDAFRAFAEETAPAFLYRLMEELNQTQKEMRFSTQPEVYLEVLAVKVSQPAAATAPLAEEKTERKSTPGEVQRLEQEVASLKKELSSLLADLKSGKIQTENGNDAIGSSDKQAARRSAVPSRNGAGTSFKPNSARAQQIMREASRQELSRLQECWGDVLDCLSVTQRAILRQAQPVVASETACILSFEYEILCQKAAEDTELQEALDEAIRRIADRPGEVVCVTTEQWSVLRKGYVQSLKTGKTADQAAEKKTEKKADKQAKPENQKQAESSRKEEMQEEDTQADARWNGEPKPSGAAFDDADIPPVSEDYYLAIEPSEDDREEQRQEEVVEQAISLFGEENVTVISD